MTASFVYAGGIMGIKRMLCAIMLFDSVRGIYLDTLAEEFMAG